MQEGAGGIGQLSRYDGAGDLRSLHLQQRFRELTELLKCNISTSREAVNQNFNRRCSTAVSHRNPLPNRSHPSIREEYRHFELKLLSSIILL